MEDLEVIRKIHFTKQILHDNIHRHVFVLTIIIILNITFMLTVFLMQCVSWPYLKILCKIVETKFMGAIRTLKI